ncbi:tyrosine-type recombinase/integrase [Shewanella sp. 125m-1]
MNPYCNEAKQPLFINPSTRKAFSGSKGLYNAVKREFIRMGLSFHGAQAFRHTFATRSVSVGINFEEVAKYLGHSDIDMVRNRYTDKERLVVGLGQEHLFNQL